VYLKKCVPPKALPQTTKKKRSSYSRIAILPTTEAMLQAFGRFLELDVASGDAATDTVYTYQRRVAYYIDWCSESGINPAVATTEDVKRYRHYLMQEKHQKPATVALSLTVIRRFYAAAISQGLVKENPGEGIKPPKDKVDATQRLNYLEEEELRRFLSAVKRDGSLKSLRDRCLLSIMALQGSRTVELHRANIRDLIRSGNNLGLRVEGKGSIRTIPLRPDIAQVMWQYLEAREISGETLTLESPLFVAVGNRFGGQRLSRRGIRWIVDEYLKAIDLKAKPTQEKNLKLEQLLTQERRLSAHSLRHTAGTLGIRHGGDLRQVQDLLGHSDSKMTALYAHINERYTHNPALGIDVEV